MSTYNSIQSSLALLLYMFEYMCIILLHSYMHICTHTRVRCIHVHIQGYIYICVYIYIRIRFHNIPYIRSKELITQDPTFDRYDKHNYIDADNGHPTTHFNKLVSEEIKRVILNQPSGWCQVDPPLFRPPAKKLYLKVQVQYDLLVLFVINHLLSMRISHFLWLLALTNTNSFAQSIPTAYEAKVYRSLQTGTKTREGHFVEARF